MIPTTPIRKALNDPQLFGNVLSGDSWASWRILLIAAMGEPLTPDERVIFKQLTGRDRERPFERVEELRASLPAGAAARAGQRQRWPAYLAGLCEHKYLPVPGETGVLLCVAPDTTQARIVLKLRRERRFEQSHHPLPI